MPIPPRATVILPTYNRAAYLVETLGGLRPVTIDGKQVLVRG